jgi:hypothetical protein
MAQAKKMMSKVKALRYAEGGDVASADTEKLGALLYRKRDEEPASSSSVDLKRMGKQAALLGLGFAPGAGISDYFGTFPAVEGGTEPGAVENFQQGNYGTAALQGLGAMGDIAMGIPVAGAAVGSVMKAPRAIQRGMTASDALKKLPKVSEQGFYSQVEKAILDNPQQKGSGQQFLAQLQKTPGVKAEELQYTGLDTFLTSKPTVTKAEIEDYLDTNRVQVQEVQLGKGNKKPLEELTDNELKNEYNKMMNSSVEEDFGGDWREFKEEIRWYLSNPESENNYFADPTKFSPYTLPGGENYREVLLTLPEKTPANFPDFDSYFNERYLNSSNGYTTPEAIAYARQDAMRNWKNSGEQIPMSDASAGNYTSSHFDQSNILAHMRLNDRVIDGKPTLFIEEIQSDWHQAGRKKGYNPRVKEQRKATTAKMMEGYWEVRDQNGEFITNVIDKRQDEASALSTANARIAENNPIQIASSNRVPDAPFKTTWDDLALKRAIKIASDEGYDKIAFTTGKTQAARYDLSKQIQKIIYGQPDENGLRRVEAITPTGDKLLGKKYSISEIEDNVGKEVAEKITKSVGVFDERTGTYSMGGVDLEIGGEGMKGFYDKMLPKKLEKLGKQYGVKVEKTLMPTERVSMEGGVPLIYPEKVEVWSMDVPAEMKEKVSTQGQPLFQIGAGAAGTAGIMGLSAGEENQGAQ